MQFSAILQPSPVEHQPRGITNDLCQHTEVPLSGLWLLYRDAEGNPQLVAPSITLLPDGHSGRVALRACDDPELQNAQVKAYGVPGNLLNLLISETGAILVDD